MAQTAYFTRDAEGAQAAQFQWAGEYDDGNWHHFAAVYDGEEGLASYVDGSPVAEKASPAGPLVDSGTLLALGAAVADPVQELYRGDLDHVIVHDRALTADEVSAISEAQNRAEDARVAMWTFDQVERSRVADQVGDHPLFLAGGPATIEDGARTEPDAYGFLQQTPALAFDGDDDFAATPAADDLSLTEGVSVTFFFRTEQAVE
jgi:hypothetical protein